MRLFRNALAVGRIKGFPALLRVFVHGCRVALAARLDELSALILLLRARVLWR